MCVKMVSDPTGYTLSPTRQSPCPHFWFHSQVQVVTLASDQLTLVRAFHNPSLINSLARVHKFHRIQETRLLLIRVPIYYQAHQDEQPLEEVQRMGPRRVSSAESSVPVHVGAGPCQGGPWVSANWDAHCMSLWPCRPPSCMSPSRRLIRQCLWSKNELPDSLFELLWHWPIRETEGHLITAGWGRSPDPLSPPLWSPLTLPRLPPAPY